MSEFEMVEKIREKANVSYAEAKQALEATDWNLLEAMVLLEQEGKVAHKAEDLSESAHFIHKENEAEERLNEEEVEEEAKKETEEEAKTEARTGQKTERDKTERDKEEKKKECSKRINRIFEDIKNLIKRANERTLEIQSGEHTRLNIPITVLVLILILLAPALPLVIIAVIISYLCGVRFRFKLVDEESKTRAEEEVRKVQAEEANGNLS